MLKRRDVLKVLAAGTLASGAAPRDPGARRRDGPAAPPAASAAPPPGNPSAARPNFLWISCEDTGPHLGCYGDPHARTPTLDRLAAEGVRFTRAFTVAGVCAPSRSGIITGLYPTTLGSQHMRCRATLPDGVKCFPEVLREAGYYCTNNSKTDYNFPVPKGAWDASSGEAHWRGRKAGQPFFAVFNFTTTHEGQIRASASAHAKNTSRLTADQRQDPARLTTLPPFLPDTPAARRDWAQYYECVTAMDYQAADVLKQLAEDGLLENTIVFFWGDHGVGLPRCKRWLYDSGTHVPLLVRLPEKFRSPGQGAPGSVCEDLVSMLDLGPTLLNLAGLKVPPIMQGRPVLGPGLPPPREYVFGARDRMDERYDVIRAVRDRRYRYVRNYEPFKPYYQYMNTPEGGPTMQELRRLGAAGGLSPAAALFLAPSKPAEELYDLQADPHEICNLAASPDHRAVLDRLRAVHEQWMLQTRDLGLIPEPDMEERAVRLGSEYAILRQDGGEALLARLREVAALAAGAPGALPRLVETLADADPAVRYWAAIGLGNLGEAAAPAADRLAAVLQDASAVVRVAAARALARLGREADGAAALARELAGPAEWVRLHAALALDELGPKARPAEAALEAALKDANKYVARVANHALNALRGTNRQVP